MWLNICTYMTACGTHLFKSSTGNDVCRPCPRDSDTFKMASVECRCRRSFYRAASEPADTPCTRLLATLCYIYIYYSALITQRSTMMSVSVWLSLCPHTYLKNRTFELYDYFLCM